MWTGRCPHVVLSAHKLKNISSLHHSETVFSFNSLIIVGPIEGLLRLEARSESPTATATNATNVRNVLILVATATSSSTTEERSNLMIYECSYIGSFPTKPP